MTAKTDDITFTVTRSINAPRDTVWAAWTQPNHLAKWWGPKGLTLRVETLEFKPGGLFHYAMIMPTGQTMWGRFLYGAIDAPNTFEFINSFADQDGKVIRAPFSPTWPLDVSNVITFDDHGETTVMTLRGTPVNANADEQQTFKMGHASMTMGFNGTFDQLVDYLKQL